MNPNVGFMYLFRFCSNKFEFVSAVSSYRSVPAPDGGASFPEQPRAGGCGADMAVASGRPQTASGRTGKPNHSRTLAASHKQEQKKRHNVTYNITML